MKNRNHKLLYSLSLGLSTCLLFYLLNTLFHAQNAYSPKTFYIKQNKQHTNLNHIQTSEPHEFYTLNLPYTPCCEINEIEIDDEFAESQNGYFLLKKISSDGFFPTAEIIYKNLQYKLYLKYCCLRIHTV